MIDSGERDRAGRQVTLRPVDDDNWRAVADVAPGTTSGSGCPRWRPATCLLTMRSEVWTSLAVYADETVVGHVMWGVDDDGSRWIGGMVIDAAEQGRGVGRAAVATLAGWLAAQGEPVRLSYHPDNTDAARLYTALGFRPTGAMEDDELVAELAPAAG